MTQSPNSDWDIKRCGDQPIWHRFRTSFGVIRIHMEASSPSQIRQSMLVFHKNGVKQRKLWRAKIYSTNRI